ncbi:hypothetical protein NEIFLAOT_01956 [Neisseria flavescens NRL30031/H210]|uniref:Uncharacterized protein n=1 Tax=Neisseria flavescens NRL30031/H210 TaxID=546264 RepID=C0EPR6_NEIFL|nr:hypothetical protein NEIFLAOT_01956 [Neisseria flavescens NRL30031/H210]
MTRRGRPSETKFSDGLKNIDLSFLPFAHISDPVQTYSKHYQNYEYPRLLRNPWCCPQR